MEIKIIKAEPVVAPPDTFCLTGTMEELSLIKTCLDYFHFDKSQSSSTTHGTIAAKRLADKLPGNMYDWGDATKIA
jgi:hypothetical protein